MAGEFTGDEVRIRDAEGSVVMQRKQPRTAFGSLRRTFWWDDLDFLYFAGYATWNYLITPFIFLRPGFSFEYLGERRAGEGVFTCLRVMFPPGVPSHCRVQTFYFDRDLLLRRLDYTAEVVGGWAHAAHFCHDYRNFAGLMVPTRRHVYPTIRGRVVRLPVLVHIDLHELQPRQGE